MGCRSGQGEGSQQQVVPRIVILLGSVRLKVGFRVITSKSSLWILVSLVLG